MPRVNSYTNWGRLEEVWLGDCYPAHFYNHLESEVRDVFYEITQKTQEDLAVIQRKLEDFGVVVQRPRYGNIDQFLTPNDQLIKPEICPRDYYLVAGNKLIGSDYFNMWRHALDQYRADPESSVLKSLSVNHLGHVCGANTVRAGRDIYLDLFHCYNQQSTLDQRMDEYQRRVAPYFQDYRVHLLFNGGHVDGCFAVAKPGVLITSQYFKDYDHTFPNWKHINVTAPEFDTHQTPKGLGYNGKWWNTTASPSRAFNDHIIKHALDWVGNYTETYFEVNCLVIDEKNILMLGENEKVFRELEQHGITAHSLPFRTRTFWDGGLHCLTLDIRRQDSMIDLFPDRDQPVYLYNNP
jgi:hypothetical protein